MAGRKEGFLSLQPNDHLLKNHNHTRYPSTRVFLFKAMQY